MSAWCLGIFVFFMSRADSDNHIPLLLWSYGAALGPWMYMAQKEQQAGSPGGETITIFFAQVAYITIALMLLFTRSGLFSMGVIFAGIMLIGLLFQFGVAFAMLREQKRMGLL